jgi:hypothetical protein
VDFLGLSKWIVDDIHVQLNFTVDAIPVVHHFILVSAEPNHHPHWQMLQRTHRSYARKDARRKKKACFGHSRLRTLKKAFEKIKRE